MHLLSVFLTIIFAATINGAIPNFSIDLDRPAYDRWQEVAKQYGPLVQKTIDEGLHNRFPKVMLQHLGVISEEIEKFMVQPYLDEVKGFAAHGNISLSGLVFIQLLYEATAYCTSIVCVTDKGVVWHARNLDYGHNPEEVKFLKELTINVDFVKGGTSIYKGTSYAGLLGLATGVRRNGFSITLNQRDKGSLLQNILSFLEDIISTGSFTTAFMDIRSILDGVPNFDTAVAQLSSHRLIAPCYLIIGGLSNNEGVVITRSQTRAVNILRLNVTESRWFLVETNYDNWVPPPPDDDRRDPAKHAMNRMSREGIDVKNLFQVLWTPPVKNNHTIYSTVMSATGYNLTSFVP